MHHTGKSREFLENKKNVKFLGLSQFDIDLWYKAILSRAKNGKLTKQQMVSIYKDMSDLDSNRINEVVDSLEKVFDEDHSGSVGKRNAYLLIQF